MFAANCRSVALAERIERIRSGRVPAARNGKRIDDPVEAQGFLADQSKLVIQKHDVELGVVNDERVVADKRQKIAHDIAKQRLADEKFGRNAVNALGPQPERRAQD